MSYNQNKPDTVYFFGTCLVEGLYPEVGMAAIKLLSKAGVRVVFPRGQTCCGQPAYNSGFPEEAKKVARHQISLFPEDHPIVVPSGSCAGMMKVHYPILFAEEPDQSEIAAFSERIFELSEFLVRIMEFRLADLGDPVSVTWHSSCHAAREMKVIEDSKSLLRQLHNVSLVDLENEQQCCGFGGTFSVKQPDISAAMVRDKLEAIEKTGASEVISGDCGCLLNISGAAEYLKSSVKCRHLAEFIWERTHES